MIRSPEVGCYPQTTVRRESDRYIVDNVCPKETLVTTLRGDFTTRVELENAKPTPRSVQVVAFDRVHKGVLHPRTTAG
jgi:hypothetical protein